MNNPFRRTKDDHSWIHNGHKWIAQQNARHEKSTPSTLFQTLASLIAVALIAYGTFSLLLTFYLKVQGIEIRFVHPELEAQEEELKRLKEKTRYQNLPCPSTNKYTCLTT